jgi:hypothetical protein
VRNGVTAVVVGALMMALSGIAVARPQPRPAAVVRQTWVAWIRATYAGDPRGCALADGRFRQAFVSSSRRDFGSSIRDCADALQAWGALIHRTRARIGPQLRVVARARISIQGQRAILDDATDRVIFVRSSGRWLIDRWPKG